MCPGDSGPRRNESRNSVQHILDTLHRMLRREHVISCRLAGLHSDIAAAAESALQWTYQYNSVSSNTLDSSSTRQNGSRQGRVVLARTDGPIMR